MAKKKRAAAEAVLTREGKFAWWLILALVALVPLVMGNGPLGWMGLDFADGFDGVKIFVLRVGVMAILAAWIWDVLRNGGEIRYHSAYILLGIFLLWVLITTLTSISPATAFLGKYRRYDGAWSYLLYALLLFLTMQYATSRLRIRQLAQALSVSSFFVAAYGLLQAIPSPFAVTNPATGAVANWDPLTWPPLPFEPLRSFSTFGNPNLLAGFLAFSIFVNLGLLLSEENKKWRRWYWLVLLVNSAVAITAFSRSLWVALLAVGIIFAFFLWHQKIKPLKEDYLFAGGLVAIVGAFIAYSLTRADAVMNMWIRIQTIFDFDQGSGLTRTQIWEAAFAAIAQRPIFGYGLDTFRLIFRHFAPAEYAQAAGFRSVADNAHNFPLQLATGIGIVGALMFFALLFWLAYLALRTCLNRGEGAGAELEDLQGNKLGSRVLYISIFCACVAYFVHLFFGLSLPSTTFLLWILMGVLLVPHAKVLRVKKSSWALPIALSFSVVLLVPVIFSFRLIAADVIYFRPAGVVARGVHASTMSDLRIAKDEAARVVRLNPFYERYYVDYFVLSTAYALNHKMNGSAEAAAALEEAHAKADHLIEMSPWEYDSYLAVATFYLNLGRILEGEQSRVYTEKAADFMRDKIERTPTGLALRVRYAEALLDLGDREEAIDQLEFVVAHDTNYVQAIDMLRELRTELEESVIETP